METNSEIANDLMKISQLDITSGSGKRNDYLGGIFFVKISNSKFNTLYLDWEEYFMGIAMLAAQRSKDPATQGVIWFSTSINTILSLNSFKLFHCSRGLYRQSRKAYRWHRV